MVQAVTTNEGIPAIPSIVVDDKNLQQMLDALKESIEVLTGTRGDPNNRALTYGEATEGGLTDLFVTNRVVETAQGSQTACQLTGDVIGIGLFTDTGNVQVDTSINLPNVVCIDGGSASETYPGAVTGPYGVASGAGDFLPTGGTAGQLLIKQSATDGDAIWSTFGASPDKTIYCPNYPYTYFTAASWKVEDYDVTNLFTPGKRCQFTDGASTYYGIVLSSGFGANDTTITMDMEGSDVLTPTIGEVCLTTDGTGWTPVAGDPFSSTTVNDITAGYIGGIKYWVAVGNTGRLATSVDKGVTWTLRTTGTTSNFTQVAYNFDSQTFIAVGDGAVVCRSTDGTTWSSNTSEITALLASGTGDIIGIAYDENNIDYWVLIHRYDSATAMRCAYSTDDGVNWVVGATNLGADTNNYYQSKMGIYRTTGQAQQYIIWGYLDDLYYISSADDTTAAVLINSSGEPAVRAFSVFYYDSAINSAVSHGPELWRAGSVLDDVSFGANDILGIAHSLTLERIVCVGGLSTIATYEMSQFDAVAPQDHLEAQTNGGNPTSTYNCVHWDADDAVFIAGNNQGQIVRSTNGLGAPTNADIYTGTFALETADPFSGGAINRIATGVISGTQWWVIIGDNGQLATSTDKGVTWTIRTTGTTENLDCIGYNSDDQQFFVGCTGGEFLHSTTGTTWTRDSTTIAALSVAGNNDFRAVDWSVPQQTWIVGFTSTVAETTCRLYRTTSAVTTFTQIESAVSIGPNTMGRMIGTSSAFTYPQQTTAQNFQYIVNNTDTSDSTYISGTNVGASGSAMGFGDGTGVWGNNTIFGWENGRLYRGSFNGSSIPTQRGYILSGGADPRVTTQRINGIAFSSSAARWIVVCNNAEIYACENSAFDASHDSWATCGNSFAGNIKDVARNDTDGYFIAVSDVGEIGRSTDGIS